MGGMGRSGEICGDLRRSVEICGDLGRSGGAHLIVEGGVLDEEVGGDDRDGELEPDLRLPRVTKGGMVRRAWEVRRGADVRVPVRGAPRGS